MREFIIYKKKNNERVVQSIVRTSDLVESFNLATEQATQLDTELYLDVDGKSYRVESKRQFEINSNKLIKLKQLVNKALAEIDQLNTTLENINNIRNLIL